MYIQHLQVALAENMSYITVLADKTGRLVLKVLDLEGRIAKTLDTMVSEGDQQLPFNINDLTNGRYVLNAFSGDRFITAIKFIKQ